MDKDYKVEWEIPLGNGFFGRVFAKNTAHWKYRLFHPEIVYKLLVGPAGALSHGYVQVLTLKPEKTMEEAMSKVQQLTRFLGRDLVNAADEMKVQETIRS